MLCSNTTPHKRRLLKSRLQKKIRKHKKKAGQIQLSKQKKGTLKAPFPKMSQRDQGA
jgi:hypothetical protein